MYGILGGVKMIFRLRVPGDSTHPIHYYTIHQLAYYILHTYIFTTGKRAYIRPGPSVLSR